MNKDMGEWRNPEWKLRALLRTIKVNNNKSVCNGTKWAVS